MDSTDVGGSNNQFDGLKKTGRYIGGPFSVSAGRAHSSDRRVQVYSDHKLFLIDIDFCPGMQIRLT